MFLEETAPAVTLQSSLGREQTSKNELSEIADSLLIFLTFLVQYICNLTIGEGFLFLNMAPMAERVTYGKNMGFFSFLALEIAS